MKIPAVTGFFAATLGAIAVVACASAPQIPNDAFQAADIAIANAEKEHASEYAPAELQSARVKITAARAAVANNPEEKDVIQARRLADEAHADAELASARGRDGRAEAVNAELQKNIDTLRKELQRSSGGAS
jgi:hypothetical protein